MRMKHFCARSWPRFRIDWHVGARLAAVAVLWSVAEEFVSRQAVESLAANSSCASMPMPAYEKLSFA
jgi:hypothetical protein